MVVDRAGRRRQSAPVRRHRRPARRATVHSPDVRRPARGPARLRRGACHRMVSPVTDSSRSSWPSRCRWPWPAGPCPARAAPLADPEPVGVVAAAPGARGRGAASTRPRTPWGGGAPRRRPARVAPDKPVRAALPGGSRFAGPLAGRGVVVVDHGATRTTYEPVVGHGRRRATRWPPAAGSARSSSRGSHCFPARLPALGLAARARPTSTRSAWSAPDRCGCSPSSGGRPGRRPRAPAPARWARLATRWLRPAGAPAGRPAAAGRW